MKGVGERGVEVKMMEKGVEIVGLEGGGGE